MPTKKTLRNVARNLALVPVRFEKLETLSADDLQSCVNLMRNTRDADRWTAIEWLKLFLAYRACAWDLAPDDWSQDQCRAVIQFGIVPEFMETEHGLKAVDPAPMIRAAKAQGKLRTEARQKQARDKETVADLLNKGFSKKEAGVKLTEAGIDNAIRVSNVPYNPSHHMLSCSSRRGFECNCGDHDPEKLA